MKEVLEETEEYRYLDDNSLKKLRELRNIAMRANILQEKIITIVDGVYGVFPWIGTREMLAFEFSLKQEGIENQVYYRAGVPIFTQIKTKMTKEEVEETVENLKYKKINKEEFEIPDLLQKNGKYNFMIPKELLQKQFRKDCIDVESMQEEL